MAVESLTNKKIKRLRDAMRHVTVVVICGAVLSGCSTMQSVRQQLPASLGGTAVADAKIQQRPVLPEVDIAQPEGGLERFKPTGFSLGTWLDPLLSRQEGTLFEPVPRLHQDHAIVYLYRPASRWNDQEIIAPNLYLNTERIPSLRSGHYYWVELPAGTYRLAVRRPLGNINFQKGTVLDFQVQAGQTYYLRYDEQNFRGKPDRSLGLLQKGPISQMPTEQGLREIAMTRLNTAGYAFVDNPDFAAGSRLPTSNNRPPDAVQRDRLTEREKPALGVPFKLWNPLTW